MTKVSLNVPEKIHLKLKKEQLDREIRDEKINLADLYTEVLELGIKSLEENKKASQK